jgi:hypothetical protein
MPKKKKPNTKETNDKVDDAQKPQIQLQGN